MVRKAAAPKVIEIDFDDYEGDKFETYDGDDPPKGFYTFELVNYGEHESAAGNWGIRWVFRLVDEPYTGWTRMVYSNLDTTKWKTQELVKALMGGSEEKVKLSFSDKGKELFLKKVKLVRGKVQLRKDSDPDDPEFELGKIITLDEAKMAARRKAAGVAEEEEYDDSEEEFEEAEEFEDGEEEAEDDEEDLEEEEEEEDSEEEEPDDEEEDEEEFEEEEEEEEEEPPPPPKKKAAVKKTTSKVTPISSARRRRS